MHNARITNQLSRNADGGKEEEMHWPQIILISWYMLSLGVNLTRHGEEREGKYSFWSSLLVVIILFALLKAGGFFG